jgi:hypothetical protein
LRLRSSTPRIVIGENSSVPDMAFLIRVAHRCPGKARAMFISGPDDIRAASRGKAGSLHGGHVFRTSFRQ